jgi:spore coat protein CotF
MMHRHLGAHETMEIHEVLTWSINAINQFQLYRPYIKDGQLRSILDHQTAFMVQEYNNIVGLLANRGMEQGRGYMDPARQNFTPMYGLHNPSNESPNSSVRGLDDREIASAMLGAHKSSATYRMHATLECADPQLRHTMMQAANSCAEQAYEVFQYMNARGYYQVPTLQNQTMQTLMDIYQPHAMNGTYNPLSAMGTSPFRQ